VGGSPIVFSEEVITLILISNASFTVDHFNLLIYSIEENFNENTNISTVQADFSTTDGSDITMCVEFFIVESSSKTSNVSYCETGNSGSVTPAVPFLLNRNNTYELQVYIVSSTGRKTILETFRYNSINSFSEILNTYAILRPFMLFLWIALISIGLYSGVLPIIAILGIFLAVAEIVLFPNYMIATGMVLKLLICIQILYFGRKKEDFN